MSIEFIWLDGTQESDSVSLNDRDFRGLNAALSALRSKTGVVIDPYGDTRLSPEHVRILLEYITNSSDQLRGIDRLLDMLKRSVTESRWLLVVGD